MALYISEEHFKQHCKALRTTGKCQTLIITDLFIKSVHNVITNSSHTRLMYQGIRFRIKINAELFKELVDNVEMKNSKSNAYEPNFSQKEDAVIYQPVWQGL